MDASEQEMVIRRGALPGHKIFLLVHAELKIFSSEVVGDRNNMLLVLEDAVELDVPVAIINKVN